MVLRRKNPLQNTDIGFGGDRLWAPWRSEYILGARAANLRGCIFCFQKITARLRPDRYILYDDQLALVMLNKYPYNNGHLMVAPRRHRASPEHLRTEERSAIERLLVESVQILRRALRPDGLNVGMNLGRVAGAGFAAHMHWHLVPRWTGDNNFMPVLASTRVLSQHLKASYATLTPLFKTLRSPVS
jgi:ATP adenylyltransferase